MRLLRIATFALAVAFFAFLAAKAPDGAYQTAELRFMRSLRHDGEPIGPWWLADGVRDLTALGSATVLVLLTVLILGYLVLSRRRRIAVLIAASTAGGEILNAVLKNTFDRARPDPELHVVKVVSTSFPSGHAMAASIFYLTIGVLLARTATRRREKIYLVTVALLLTALTAFSRVYLGVHYPSDVLAGCAAGTAWALLCWFVADWLARRGALKREMEPPADA